MITQGLELRQTQKLSPLQIQTIKLIEMPTLELEQRIRAELEENPVIEEVSVKREDEAPDVSLDELKDDDYIPAYKLKVRNWGPDAKPEYNTFSTQKTFTQMLLDQLGFRNLSEKQSQIGEYIIGSLDSDGYLRRSISAIVDDLAFRAGIETDEEEVLSVLSLVQEFEPSGVGARDLRECLLLQLRSSGNSQDVKDAVLILEKTFEEFTNRHFQKIMAKLSISEDRLKAAKARIVRLNPTPGGQAEDAYVEHSQQIVPDFILSDDGDGHLSFSTPRFHIPELRVNRRYEELLESAGNASDRAKKDAALFVKQKLDSAKWFIEAVKQRQNTMVKTMQAILDYQYSYLLSGEESDLRPMVLKDIAEKTGFDISTVSRVVNSKYIETSFGIIPLKFFFSEGIENKEGEEISTRELKKALKECIDAEDKRKPLTDEQLVSEMNARGYKVARRTIAKYRDQLGIPLARWRKEL